jgi:hypothetical protein
VPVPNAAYFRRQADICLRLSLITSDAAVSTRLLAMARDYRAASEALEQPASNLPAADRRAEEDAMDGEESVPMPPGRPDST